MWKRHGQSCPGPDNITRYYKVKSLLHCAEKDFITPQLALFYVFDGNEHYSTAKLNLNYSAFRKKFLQQTGISPGKYLINKRIEKAYELLLREIRVSEVAEMLQYPDIYTFSRQFKKYTGTRPEKVKSKSCPLCFS